MEAANNNSLLTLPKNMSAEQSFDRLFSSLLITLKEDPNEIRFIRKNLRPLFIEKWVTQDNAFLYENLSEIVSIPSRIIAELVDHLQLIWYIESVNVTLCNENLECNSLDRNNIANDMVDTLSMTATYTPSDLKAIIWFLNFLSSTWLIQEISSKNIERSSLPRWILRWISLFDVNYSKFDTIEKYLAFLKVNIEQQELLFSSSYLEMISQNWWLPVDDIKEKETTMFSSDKYIGSVGTIEFNEKEYDLSVRIIPWFSPVWVAFALSINLPNQKTKNTSNENYLSIVWVQFEDELLNGKRNIIPVVHTIQSSTHNIWTNLNWDLEFVREPHIPEDVTILWSNERAKLYDSCMNLLLDKNDLTSLMDSTFHSNWLKYIQWLTWIWKKGISSEIVEKATAAFIKNNYSPTTTLSWFVTLFFLEKWYKNVQIIDPKENQRLMQHNQDRTTQSITKSSANMYQKMSKILWWVALPNWRHTISSKWFASQFVNRELLSLSFLNIDKLVRASQSRTGKDSEFSLWVQPFINNEDPLLKEFIDEKNNNLFSNDLTYE